MTCTPTTHDVFRSLPTLWLALPKAGRNGDHVFKGYDDDGERDPSRDLACRNCELCHSTICIPLAQERRWLEEREQKTVKEMPLDGQWSVPL